MIRGRRRVRAQTWIVSLILASCASGGSMPHKILDPAGQPRGFAWGQAEAGGVDLNVAATWHPDDAVQLPTRVTFDLDDRVRPFVIWQPFAFTNREDDSWDLRGSGDFVAGASQRLSSGGNDDLFSPLVSIQAFAVFPHGGPRPPLWPGIIEGEEGYFALLSSEWGDMDRSFTLNVGGGAAGRVGSFVTGSSFVRNTQAGRGGRVFASCAFTQGLGSTGIEFATEPSRLGAELAYLRDPVDDRDYLELHVGLSFWLGANEIDIGWRRGLTSDTEDNVLYIGSRVRLFDTLSF
ncbi:MAG: hypothetical protein H6832_18410 [Planctomycetes bacterium]|nr:hypothetical protein [Planctomycetota bacterium]MCB9891683.1 hypothetical protein [Planctomycetota bacterium]MCB9920381.1 hypothetical protein [Planctomycetota bacterium]